MKAIVGITLIAVCASFAIPCRSCLAEIDKNVLQNDKVEKIPGMSVEKLQTMSKIKEELVGAKNTNSKEMQYTKEKEIGSIVKDLKEVMKDKMNNQNVIIGKAPDAGLEKPLYKEMLPEKLLSGKVPSAIKDRKLTEVPTILVSNKEPDSVTTINKPIIYSDVFDRYGFTGCASISCKVEIIDKRTEDKYKEEINKVAPQLDTVMPPKELVPNLPKKNPLETELLTLLKGPNGYKRPSILEVYNQEGQDAPEDRLTPMVYQQIPYRPYYRTGAVISYTIEATRISEE